MKKIMLSILMGCMVLTLCACGSEKDNVNNDNNKKIENKDTNEKYADLTMTRRIGIMDDLWIDLPNWREDGSETCIVAEYLNYYIIAITSKEDKDFESLYNNTAKLDLKHFVDRGTYEDFTPEMEDVKLKNGIKVNKFNGTLKFEDYGDQYEYPAYGYYLKFNDYPIMVMAIETNTGSKNNSDEEWFKAKTYVDQAVETIRSKE